MAAFWHPTGSGDAEEQAGLLDRDVLDDKFSDEDDSCFWGHHLLHCSGRLSQDLDLGLQLRDPRPGRGVIQPVVGSAT
jgi:hypothetical protein